MKNIYFKNPSENKLKNKLMLKSTYLFNKYLPDTSYHLFYKLLLNPHGRRTYSFGDDLKPTKCFKIKTLLGGIQVCYFEAGPKNILFTHGWADNSRSFKKMIQSQLDAGNSCWVFDHIGHGKSEGDIAHVFGFIDGLEKVIAHINKKTKLDAIITHSMAGVAVMNLSEDTLKDLKVIMISLPSQFVPALYARLNKMGIDSSILEKLMSEVATKYNRDWNQLATELNIHKLEAKSSLLIHDIKDSQALFEPASQIFKNSGIDVFPTTGLGHKKVLINAAVLNKIKDVLDSN